MEIKTESFEELDEEAGSKQEQSPEQKGGSANRPDLRVVQPDIDKDGKTRYVNVGGMWKNVSKNGTEYYSLKIGQLKLLVFPNDKNADK
ncbi:MAG: hypothetical protein ACP5NX_01350 [Candidatus Bilamarchaeaceae archaeon]